MKIAYRYDSFGYLVGVAECQRDPFSGDWLTPSDSTQMAPPECTDEQVPKWDGTAWSIVEDHRGKAYYLPEDEWPAEPRFMLTPGPFPAKAIFTAPAEPTPAEKWQRHIAQAYAGKSVEAIRQMMYEQLRYKFVQDDFLLGPDENNPLCNIDGEALTVDEAKQLWLRYFGDDDTKADEALTASIAAKQYVRTVMATWQGVS
jgi:hypothetical protein